MLLFNHYSCFAFVLLFMLIEVNISGPFAYADNGWRPLSREEAFRRVRVNMEGANVEPWITADTVNQHLEILALKNNVLKVVEPVKHFNGFNTKSFDTMNKSNEDNYRDITSTVKYVRIAKKLSEETLDNKINEQKSISKFKDEEPKETEIKNSYKVTEESDERKDLLNTDQTNLKDKIKPGYIYNPPLINKLEFQDETENKLTNKLKETLVKYKINDQISENYVKSRESRNRNLIKSEVIFLPIPVRNYQSFNTNSHLPVNPVLAVLLSNYRFYAPGLYGLQNAYTNLYGYLASNNIHNNRPFGMYKVYSDTDSSN